MFSAFKTFANIQCSLVVAISEPPMFTQFTNSAKHGKYVVVLLHALFPLARKLVTNPRCNKLFYCSSFSTNKGTIIMLNKPRQEFLFYVW